METQNFNDRIAFDRGHNASIPPEQTPEVGDVAASGENVLFSPYGQPTAWRGVSLVNQPAAALLQLVGDKIGGIGAGNVLLGPGGSIWFIGQGKAFVGDFSKALGVASSLLQFSYQGQTYQAGLPAPPAPLLSLGLDSLGNAQIGRAKGRLAAVLTRRRAATGAESAASLVSNVVTATNNQIVVQFPPALSVVGQDEWGLYFTRTNLEAGTLFLLRVIKESEIGATIGAGAGEGLALASVTALSSHLTNGRIAAYALAKSGASAATVTGSVFSATAGNQISLRLTRPTTVAENDKLLVGLSVEQSHGISRLNYNGGFVEPASVYGAWKQAGSIGDPNGETVQIEQISATQYQWKLASSGSWTGPVTMSTSPTALGATGLSVVWSAASSEFEQVGNQWQITPLPVYEPAGWALEDVVSDTNDAGSLFVFSRTASVSEPEFYEFTVGTATRLTASLVVFNGAASGISKRKTQLTTNATTHTATFTVAPAADERVVAYFAGAGDVTFSPQSPLQSLGNSSQSVRQMTLDFTDADLLEVEAPQGVEGPPAGTHAFIMGPSIVIGGTSDGTALNISQPNQFEQFDLALTVYLNPVEQLMRAETRQHDGSTYLMTRNSVQIPVFTGEPDLPILTRALWPQTGIANPNASTMTPRGLYAFSERGGAVRSSGRSEPDTDFARPVQVPMQSWVPEDVVLCNDRRNGGMVLFCHQRSIYVYFEQHGRWSTPLDVSDFYYYIRQSANDGAMDAGSYELNSASNPFTAFDQGKFVTVAGAGVNGTNLETIVETVSAAGVVRLRDAAQTAVTGANFSWGADVSQVKIVSAVTSNGRAYLAIGDAGYSELYEFHCGLGTKWKVRSVARHAGAVGRRKTLRNMQLLADFDSQVAMTYNRLTNLRVSANRLVADSPTDAGYALGDVFATKNAQHGTTYFWEWQLLEPLRKERGAILAKASQLRPTPLPNPPLKTLDYAGGLVAWRVDDERKLEVFAAGSSSGSVGTPTVPPAVSTSTLANGTVGSLYNATLAATGGITPYTWDLSAGSLPAGLTLAVNGTITGTPTTAGTASFTVRVRDVNGATATRALSITVAAAPVASSLNVGFRAAASSNIVRFSLALKKSAGILNTSNLRIEDASGNPQAAQFRIHIRWNAEATNVAAPAKYVLVDFTPTATGQYFLKNSGGNPAHLTPLTINNGVSELQVVSGAFDMRLFKTGVNLVNSLTISAVEKLDSSKPQLQVPIVPNATLVRFDTSFSPNGGPAVNANATLIRVASAGLLQVGQTIRFQNKGRIRNYTTGSGSSGFNLEDIVIGNYNQSATSPLRQFIVNRGVAGREWLMSTWDYSYGGSTIYRNNSDVPATVLSGDTIEDYQAYLEPENEILSITPDMDGDIVELLYPLQYQQMQNTQIYAVGVTSMAALDVQSTTVLETGPLHSVVKQTGVLKVGATRVFEHLSVTLYWHFYAGKQFARCRLRLKNATDDVNQTVRDALLSEMKFVVPLSQSVTASDDAVLNYNDGTPNDMLRRFKNNQSASVANGTGIQLAVPLFAPMGPARLQATSSQFTYSIFPARTDGLPHRYYANWATTWEFYLGNNAQSGMPLTSQTSITMDAAYTCATNAVQYGLVPAQTWTVNEAGTARRAESMNRMEQYLRVGYATEAADTVAGTPRMSLRDWILSDLDQAGTEFARGRMLGWDAFGNLRDDGSWNYLRYDPQYSLLREYIRTGDARAFELGALFARYQMDGGIIQSAIPHNGNALYSYQGLNRPETSPSLGTVSGSTNPKPSHNWYLGLFLYWALSGDEIAYESCLLKRAESRRWNFNGVGVSSTAVDGTLADGDFRSVTWSALGRLAAYWFLGDAADLAGAKQYLDNIRLSEQSQGSDGAYIPTNRNEIEPFNIWGYGSMAYRQYIFEKRAQGSPDAEMEAFVRRQALVLTRGSANATTAGNNRVIRGGTYQNGLYQPVGIPYSWSRTGNTDNVGIEVIRGSLVIQTLFTAARFAGLTEVLDVAGQMAEDDTFYRDAPEGFRDYAQRTPINVLSRMFFFSGVKEWSKHALTYADLIYELGGAVISDSAALVAPTITFTLVDPQVEVGDRIRIELLPSEQFRVLWLDAAGALKQEQIVTLPTPNYINEPIGVKLIVAPGAVADFGTAGRVSANNNGCVNIYDDYDAVTAAFTAIYQAKGLENYGWQPINVTGPVYSVEVCGTGAEQKAAQVLLSGHQVPSHIS